MSIPIVTVNLMPPTPDVLPSPGIYRVTLPQVEWDRRSARHRQRVAAQAQAFVQRRGAGEKHPVWDFLFTYYNFSPNKLMTWVPGLGEPGVTEPDETPVQTWEAPPLPDRVRREAGWIATLCRNITTRPSRFACHGLHEWAMVYRQSAEQVRHSGYELRMTPEELATFVESQTVCCTHFDAYRFYTPEARPLNTFSPTFDTRLEMEQGGCLHANMDLYKWAYKLWPWIGSDLVADAFEVALQGRTMDMRASPYDLASLGFEPIRIETEEGRAEYRRLQQELATVAQEVRQRLAAAAEMVAGH